MFKTHCHYPISPLEWEIMLRMWDGAPSCDHSGTMHPSSFSAPMEGRKGRVKISGPGSAACSLTAPLHPHTDMRGPQFQGAYKFPGTVLPLSCFINVCKEGLFLGYFYVCSYFMYLMYVFILCMYLYF